MTDPYYLKVMGTPELLDPFGRPVRIKVRKHLALLIYLVLEGRRACRRDLLIDLLWPNANHKGSQSLSTAFYVLRSIFGASCVRAKKDIAEFHPPPLTTDLQRLQLRDALAAEDHPTLEVDEILRDFDIEDAPEFQHWRDRKRAECLPAVKSRLLQLIGDARRSGDTRTMRGLADRLLALDPLSEDGTAAQMEAAALQGDRLGALRIFEIWKRELHEQLRAVPSRELESVATRLRRRSVDLSASPAATIVERQGERPFIGRVVEYRELFEAWEATSQSRSTHVLLTGESGIGKSTLALRFGSAATLAGAAVARVQCFELEQRIAFGMMGALITELLDRPAVAGTTPESLAEVARIVPKVRERFTNLPPARNTEGEAARLHFAEGAFALFDAIMEEQPLVLIIDDYSRSDEASLSVLHLLLRRTENARLMVILTARPPEPDEPPQAGRIRRAIQHVPVRKVQLDALTETEGEALLEEILKGTGKLPAAPDRRAILRTAAGNPMALELLVRDWLAHPDAPLGLLLTAMRSDVRGAALGAEDYDQLIERILPALSARHRVALFLSVILGPRLNDFQYFSFLDLTPAQIMAALSELVEYRILRSTEAGMEFVNEVMRARLYLNIPVATRIRLHDGVATLLIDAMGRGESVSRLEIAWHCIRAKRRDEAAPHLIIGSRQSLEKGAPDEAARALSSALRELKGNVWQEAALLLAEAYDEMGDSKAVLETVREIRSVHPSDPNVRELSEELEIGARHQLGILPPTEGSDIVQQFVRGYRGRCTAIGRARAALSSARIARDLCNVPLWNELQEALARLPTETFEPKQKTLTLMAEAMVAFHRRDIETSIAAARAAVRLLEGSGSQDATLLSLTIGLGVLATAEGNYLDSIQPFRYAVSLATKLGNEGQICTAAGNLAMTYFRVGDYENQRTWALCARKYRDKSVSFDKVRSAGLLAIASTMLDLRKDAEHQLQDLRNEIAPTDPEYVKQWGQYHSADIIWLLGRKKEAFTAAVGAGARDLGPITPALTGSYARWSTKLAIECGNAKEQLAVLLGLRKTRAHLDALDRAELDCALITLCEDLALESSEFVRGFEEALTHLPPASTLHLEKLGFLVANR